MNVTRLIETEKPFKLNIRQLANGELRWDITAKGDTKEELKENIDYLLKLVAEICSPKE